MYNARKTSRRFSTVHLSLVGKKGGSLVGLAQAGAERLERLDEVPRVVLQVELAEPGRPPCEVLPFTFLETAVIMQKKNKLYFLQKTNCNHA